MGENTGEQKKKKTGSPNTVNSQIDGLQIY